MERKNLGKNLIKKTTHVLKIKDNIIRPKTKKVTFSLTVTEVEQLEKIAKETLGNPNKSGMIRYWINQNNLKNCKSDGKK